MMEEHMLLCGITMTMTITETITETDFGILSHISLIQMEIIFTTTMLLIISNMDIGNLTGKTSGMNTTPVISMGMPEAGGIWKTHLISNRIWMLDISILILTLVKMKSISI